MMLRFLLLLVALFSSGCGYIGEPLPPARHVPERVADLSASQQGARIVAQFTLPVHTTENLDITKPMRVELRVGPAATPLRTEAWEAAAKLFDDVPADQPECELHGRTLAAEDLADALGVLPRVLGVDLQVEHVLEALQARA